jgi:hypothetical protein
VHRHRRRQANDLVASYRLVTWPLNFVSRNEFWETPFPQKLEGLAWTCCC